MSKMIWNFLNSKYGWNYDIKKAKTKIIAKIYSKIINIKTHGLYKVRVTPILWIVADVTKLLRM